MTLRSPLTLRVTSIVTLVFAVGHTMGAATSWSPPGETEVLQAMTSFRFAVGGVSRSYLDFYLGFGYLITVYLLLHAVLLWQLARLAQSEPRAVRALIASCVVANLLSALVAWRFIFLVPVIFWVS